MNNINFKIKSNWFDEFGKIYNIKDKAFWLYLNLRTLELKYEDTAIISVLMLYEILNKNNFKISKNEIIKIIQTLKANKLIDYDSNKYRIKTNKELIKIKFIDLPNIKRIDNIDKPETKVDYYININMNVINYIIKCGLSHKHVIVYLYLSKFNNKCYSSCKLISDSTGLGLNQINKYYLTDLEKSTKLICNVMLKGKNKNSYNYFLICNNIEKVDEFYKKNKKYFN